MHYLSVSELRLFAQQRAVKAVTVHHSADGFALATRLGPRDEEHLVVSTRERLPRTWGRFDRLLAFMEREGIKPTELVMKFT